MKHDGNVYAVIVDELSRQGAICFGAAIHTGIVMVRDLAGLESEARTNL